MKGFRRIRNAKGIALSAGVLLALLAGNCEAAIHAVEGTVPARYFNETRSAWDHTTISIFYDDDQHVTLMGGHGRGKASVRMDRDEFDMLRSALRQGQARLQRNLNQGDVLELFRIVRDDEPYSHGMTVSYWSGSADLGGAVVLFLQDDDNPLSKMELYLGEEEVRGLLDQLARVPE